MELKKSNIWPIHKKGNKQVIINYSPVSLLPTLGNIFERLVVSSLFEDLEKYKLTSTHQSGFQANDSCADQLLSIVHNIHTAFDAYQTLESCGVVLNMSKTFDKVWHEGLIFKLESKEISNESLDLIKSLLENGFQRVAFINH